jgi:glycerol kinase
MPSGPYVVAIDQGTTGSTVVVLGSDLAVLARENREVPQHYPQPGWVEHEPDEIWASVLAALDAALAKSGIDARQIAALGITNQRETTILWERASGRPLHRAIVWQCRRTAPACAALKARGLEPEVRAKTGLLLDPYFSGTKIGWILDAVGGARARAARGEVAFGTIDTFLVHRLSGGAAHVTDVTNASRTLLFDIHAMRWSAELCEALTVPPSVLPEVRSSSEVVARTKGVPGLPDGIPIAGIAGDQQAALFGQGCFAAGDAKCTYGTGAFLVLNTGPTPITSTRRLLTTVAWRIGGETTYALEGSVFIAGAAVQWLRDGLGIIRSASEVEALARRVDDTGDLVFVPALTGLGAPQWDPDARGLICGITRDTTAAHLARATLEGIAMSIAELVGAMREETGRPLAAFKVDGGAAQNDLLMQAQADFIGSPVVRPKNIETTALGAGLLAGLAVGVWRSRDELAPRLAVDRRFEPDMNPEERERRAVRWRRAVERARG